MSEIYELRMYGPLRGFQEKDETADIIDKALKFADEKLKITDKWMKDYEDRKKNTAQ